MVDDLLERHDFHGMTREQVRFILGTPLVADIFQQPPDLHFHLINQA